LIDLLYMDYFMSIKYFYKFDPYVYSNCFEKKKFTITEIEACRNGCDDLGTE